MKHIIKKFSLEEFKSRMPGVIPSFYKGGMIPYFFGELYKEIPEEGSDKWFKGSVYSSNYDMFPCNVTFTGINKETGVINNLKLSTYSNSTTTLSYKRLVEIFHFFEEYFHLLYDYGSCGKHYTSAREYYYQETRALGPNQLHYAEDVSYYIALDDRFALLGGKNTYDYLRENFFPSVKLHNIVVIDDYDNYGWIDATNYVEIEKIKDAWKIETLYYPDLLKWQSWFDEKYSRYRNVANVEACIDTDDCCDCKEYFARGGHQMRETINSIIDDIKANIEANNKVFRTLYETAVDSLKEVTEIKNSYLDNCTERKQKLASIETLLEKYYAFFPSLQDKLMMLDKTNVIGEQSLFSDEWEYGRDYTASVLGGSIFVVNNNIERVDATDKLSHSISVVSKRSGGIDCDVKDTMAGSGTVITYNNDSYIINNSEKGYKFDDKYKEIHFGNDTVNKWTGSLYESDDKQLWSDYTAEYMKANPNEFVTNISTYTYNHNGEIIYNPTFGNRKLCNTYTANLNNGVGYAIIGGIYYPLSMDEYVIDQTYNERTNGKRYKVSYSQTYTPYIQYNAKKMYAIRRNGKWIFDICGTEHTINESIRVLHYKNNVYNASGSEVEIDSYKYPLTDGYVMIDGKKYNIPNRHASTFNLQEVSYEDNRFYLTNSSYRNCFLEDTTIFVPYSFTSYDYDKITGYTESKLVMFKSNVLHDAVGNEFECLDTGEVPENLDLMLIPYYVGKAVNVQWQNTDDGIIYWGDFMDQIEFYYKNIDGTINESTVIYPVARDPYTCGCESTTKYDMQKMINSATSWKNSCEEKGEVLEDTLYCRFTYYVGTSLVLNESSGNYHIQDVNNYNGVKYVEEVSLKITDKLYYNDVNVEPITIFYYEVQPVRETSISSQYGNEISTSIAYFESKVPRLIKKDGGYLGYKDEYGEEYGFDKYMNQFIAPTFSNEYECNIANPKNVEGDIYIDRGNITALEKLLKLGEVSSLEALEQYSNGYFNLTENT